MPSPAPPTENAPCTPVRSGERQASEGDLRQIIAHKDRLLAVHVRELQTIRDLLGAATDETALAAVKRRLAAQAVKA